MKPVSDIIKTMPKSGIRMVQEIAANVAECIRLETGEPNFTTPKFICDAAAKAMRVGWTKYTVLVGAPEVRKAIAADNSGRLGVPVDMSEVIVTTGATMAIYNALKVVAQPGDEILIPDPGWPTYKMQLHALGLKPVYYLLDEKNGMNPTRKNLEALVSAKTKAIITNSPSNPTGAVFCEETVRMMMEFAAEHDLYVISDEIYDFLTYDGVKAVSFKPFDRDGRVILIGGASKKYAMPGWRVGYAIAEPEIVRLMGQAMITDGGNCCSIAQKAYEAAITGPQDFVAESCASYDDRRRAAVRICEGAGVPVFVPQGAFYLWIDITKSKKSSEQFSEELFEKYLVGVAPGPAFGPSGEGKIRISIAADKEILCQGVQYICDLVNAAS